MGIHHSPGCSGGSDDEGLPVGADFKFGLPVDVEQLENGLFDDDPQTISEHFEQRNAGVISMLCVDGVVRGTAVNTPRNSAGKFRMDNGSIGSLI